MSVSKRRPEVVAVYYPHWHSYDHGSSWKGEGWTEWEGLKAAVPRFPGHQQPLKPLWGCFDESDPAWVEKEVDLAADHGIDVFMYCWYWYSGVRNMEEALEQGLLKARNRERVKFALMWANHDRVDQFCPEFGEKRNMWLGSHHSPRDLNRVIDYCMDHYFREPNYWKVDGGLFFSVYQATRFVEELGGPAATHKLFDEIDSKLDANGLPPMHWGAIATRPEEVPALREAGFRSTARYNISAVDRVRDPEFEEYEALIQTHRDHWAKMSAAELPNMPVVTKGWDATPRCRADVPWPFPKPEYPYVSVITGNTPERFKQLLAEARTHAEADPKQPAAITIYAWNEWTEGGFLLPEERAGNTYLEALKDVFPPTE